MLPTHTAYPEFMPNQVLSNRHLNQLFDFLYEQDRLSRTHLIGIGIVCGLTAEVTESDSGEAGVIISRGCGVTSAGHLVIWDEDEALEFYRPYAPPTNINYTFFDQPGGEATYPMWELTTDRDDDVTAERLTVDFLTGADQATGEGDAKVLMLLYECSAVDNRNCTPTNCDDKGRTIETTVRPVLVRRNDLLEIRRVLGEANPGAAAYYQLYNDLAARLELPTLKPPRFDVVNSEPASVRDIFDAYRRSLDADFLNSVQNALNACYLAVAPLVPEYGSNPFDGRVSGLTFLHNGALLAGPEAMGYQYWFDHLVTIIQAYDELRVAAEELYSLCCPDDRIFPRHLVLHHFEEGGRTNDELRHLWVSSPVQNRQQVARQRLESLFERLVALVAGNELPLPPPVGPSSPGNGGRDFVSPVARDNLRATVRDRSGGMVNNGMRRTINSMNRAAMTRRRIENRPADIVARFAAFQPVRRVVLAQPQRLTEPIRITPTFYGRELSHKAIPFYYEPETVLDLWNDALTRRGRQGQNLGYDAIDWNATDDFVRRPLAYDAEPRNFYRIEGAVSQDYRPVLRELDRQVRQYRLPIDVLALSAGAVVDELAAEDYGATFSDLEAQYASWRARFLGRIAEVTVRFYDMRLLGEQKLSSQAGRPVSPPKAPLLQLLTNYRYLSGTLGQWYEDAYGQHTDSAPFVVGLPNAYIMPMAIIHFLVRLEDRLETSLRDVNWDDTIGLVDALQTGGRSIARATALPLNDAVSGVAPNNAFIDSEEYSDQLDELITTGDLEALKALRDSFDQRRQEVLDQRLFANFQRRHPGLQFRAGAPPGGTFILVYAGRAQESDDSVGPPRAARTRISGKVIFEQDPMIGTNVSVVGSSSGTVTDIDGGFSITVLELPARLRFSMTGMPSVVRVIDGEVNDLVVDLSADPGSKSVPDIPGIQPGTVIADFYLPYRCCGKGAPAYIFPPQPPEPPVETLRAAIEQSGCSAFTGRNPTGGGLLYAAPASVEISGGVPPYTITDEAGNTRPGPVDFDALPNDSVLIISDSADNKINLRARFTRPLVITLVGDPFCAEGGQTFSHEFIVEGGRPPYRYTGPDGRTSVLPEGKIGTLSGIASGQSFTLQVFDGWGEDCMETLEVPAHDCELDDSGCGLPCGGIATRQSYPLWAQRPESEAFTYEDFKLEVSACNVTQEDGKLHAMSQGNINTLNRGFAAKLARGGTLTAGNFNFRMGELITDLVKFTDVSINRPADLEGGQRLIQFSSSSSPISRLTAEFFACDDFELTLKGSYVEVMASGQSKLERQISVTYNKDGMTLNEGEVQLPAFDRFTVNRCKENDVTQTPCREPLELRLEAQGRGNKYELTGGIEKDRATTLYISPLGEPQYASGEKVEVIYSGIVGSSRQVTALAVDPSNGCFAVDTTIVDITQVII